MEFQLKVHVFSFPKIGVDYGGFLSDHASAVKQNDIKTCIVVFFVWKVFPILSKMSSSVLGCESEC